MSNTVVFELDIPESEAAERLKKIGEELINGVLGEEYDFLNVRFNTKYEFRKDVNLGPKWELVRHAYRHDKLIDCGLHFSDHAGNMKLEPIFNTAGTYLVREGIHFSVHE
jgi:hypothetical protein